MKKRKGVWPLHTTQAVTLRRRTCLGPRFHWTSGAAEGDPTVELSSEPSTVDEKGLERSVVWEEEEETAREDKGKRLYNWYWRVRLPVRKRLREIREGKTEEEEEEEEVEMVGNLAPSG